MENEELEAREAWFKRLAYNMLDNDFLPDTEIGAAFFHDWEY
jgi:hypothetical protein